jgi:signal transduction histidine kinase
VALARTGTARQRRSAPSWALLAGIGVLAVLAARADVTTRGVGVPATMVDVAVGLAFAVAAVLSPVPALQRLLVGSVGAMWLLASLLPVRSAHQALLVAVLLCFPTGRVPSRLAWLVLVAAGPLALGWYPQPAVAATLVAAGLLSARPDNRSRPARYPLVAGTGVAAVLLGSWVVSRGASDTFDARLALLVYEYTLAAVAVGHVLASRAAVIAVARRVEQTLARVIALTDSGRLAALEPLLADAVRDPSLRVHPWDPAQSRFEHEPGVPVAPDGPHRVVVTDDTGPVAAIHARGNVLADPTTASALRAAVRLAATGQRLQDEQQRRLDDLQAARRRLLEATDRQRESVADRLRHDVLPALDAAVAQLPVPPNDAAGGPADPLGIVRGELHAASADLLGLVDGVPPEPLGQGRLETALRAVARRSPVAVNLDVEADTHADPATETTLYYVCSEAVANAIKHAHAAMIDVAVSRVGAGIQIRVRDDGRGGADPGGSGLGGLADRVAAHEGTLAVDSPVGHGTQLTVWLPVSRSIARA